MIVACVQAREVLKKQWVLQSEHWGDFAPRAADSQIVTCRGPNLAKPLQIPNGRLFWLQGSMGQLSEWAGRPNGFPGANGKGFRRATLPPILAENGRKLEIHLRDFLEPVLPAEDRGPSKLGAKQHSVRTANLSWARIVSYETVTPAAGLRTHYYKKCKK